MYCCCCWWCWGVCVHAQCLHDICVCTHIPWCPHEGQETVLCSCFFPPTLTWVQKIKPRSPGLCNKRLYPQNTLLLLFVLFWYRISVCNPSWLSPLFSWVLEFQIWDTWSHVLLKMAVFNFLALWHDTVIPKVHAQELHDGVTKKLPKTPHNVFSTLVILCWPCQVFNDSRLCQQESFFLSWLFSVISFFLL